MVETLLMKEKDTRGHSKNYKSVILRKVFKNAYKERVQVCTLKNTEDL